MLTSKFELDTNLHEIAKDSFKQRFSTEEDLFDYLARKYADKSGLTLKKRADVPAYDEDNFGAGPAVSAPLPMPKDPKAEATRTHIIVGLGDLLRLHDQFLEMISSGEASGDEDGLYAVFLGDAAASLDTNGVTPLLLKYIVMLHLCVVEGKDAPEGDDIARWLLTDPEVVAMLKKAKQLPAHVLGMEL